MGLKQYSSTTDGTRQLVGIDRSSLHKGKPFKSLCVGKKSTGGRNNYGRITFWHRGGGHKQTYRIIDFKRDKLDIVASVERIEYDPNRTAFIALLKYEDGEHRYIVAPAKLNVGDNVTSSVKCDVRVGNSMLLKNMPIGSLVHNIEMKPLKGGQISRSAGCYARIVGRDGANIVLKLSSGEVRLISGECRATIGIVSNSDHQNRSYGKAGRMRWLGRKPIVRGVAMNPIDHPHGGGEGKTSGGRHPVTPWGVGTKGKKTRSKKKMSSRMIIKGRKSR